MGGSLSLLLNKPINPVYALNGFSDSPTDLVIRRSAFVHLRLTVDISKVALNIEKSKIEFISNSGE